ncbi:hypothetical protein ACHAWO_000730 [Cyclotella atomus]|uniref:Amino acid transporter transmembrane domain-containing protein n=1 Tax=Cyclotella atomus TaxID=382360 RepID=A0ABD3PH18_9STRA
MKDTNCPKPSLPPKSPFLAPRRISSGILSSNSDHDDKSPFSIASHRSIIDNGTVIEPEHKSTLVGCTSNLITAIVGAGIIGIPYAMRETGLVAGILLIIFSGAVGCKSLRLLVETAKHVDATSYEILCEATFGGVGWILCNSNMFLMSWGPMLSYMMIVKDTAPIVLGFESEEGQNMILIICSVGIMLPLSLQRDIADLAKTSQICVIFDVFLVAMIAYYSPTSESITQNNGLLYILYNSTFRPSTCFIGLGIISFAFSCQHSSLIIAGSLENPTVARWQKVTASALGICSILAIVMGSFGYIGFMELTEGDIFNNFPLPSEGSDSIELATAKAINVARGVLCGIMFFVYPLESYVARHVIMANLFRGRDAHEGDDHAVLDRWDRRVTTTIMLFLSVLIPALHFNDVGLVLALTGTVAATSLTYLLPGLIFIGVHGDEFLALAERSWGCLSMDHFTTYHCIAWYLLLMPIWLGVARTGKRCLAFHREKKALQTPAQTFRLGRIKHKLSLTRQPKSSEHGNFESSPMAVESNSGKDTQYGSLPSSVEEDDPQEEYQTTADFFVAIGFVAFGIVALASGLLSIYWSMTGYN